MLIRKSFFTIGSIFVVLLLSGCMTYEQESGEDLEFSSTESEISFNDHDYLFVNTPKTWQQAQAYCATYNSNTSGGGGYHLVTIQNAAEESFLNANEIARGLNDWWIGYSDLGTEGSWIWSSDISTFANWSFPEPNNYYNEDCAVDRHNGADTWNDTYCNLEHPFICERNAPASGTDGAFEYNAVNTNNALTVPNTVRVSVQLSQDRVFTVGTCGLPGTIPPAGNTYLRLWGPNGFVNAASNNDSGDACGTQSNFSIVVPADGTYWIWAGCAGNTSCSGKVVYNY